MGCVEEKVQFRGNDLKSSVDVPSAEACAQICAGEAECAAWTWTKGVGRCALKTAKYAESVFMHRDAVSGQKNCGMCLKAFQDCRIE